MPGIHEILHKYFGHAAFRGQQETIIRHVLAGGHALVIMPTGMGKSLCYQIPALMPGGFVLVLSPLIALMKDQVDALVAKGIAAACLNSSLSRSEREARHAAIAAGAYCLLYVTPERFRKPEFLDVIRTRRVSLLAVDEAHCISQWGHDFRPDYSRVGEIRRLLGNPPTLALTATATPEVQQDIISQLGLSRDQIKLFHEGIARPNLHLAVRQVWGQEEKLEHLLAMSRRLPGNGICYFALIKTLQEFGGRLQSRGLTALQYHGDLDSAERRRVQNKFMQGENQLVLATNAFGMGIDKDNIRFVVHAEVPGSLEAYYQEIGRAGRDGQRSDCLLLYDEQDLLIQMDFLNWNNPDAAFYDRLYRLLLEDAEQVNACGPEGLKEKLHFKNRHDYRLETALGMLERYGVITGSLANKDLAVIGELPEELADQAWLDQKLKREQRRLYALVQYVKHQGCRKAFIHEYFGLKHADTCGACDWCLAATA
ncbi:MAG: ATP-dependent DNA helicase [candidate division KSB1 bacterium]|nr:ATP-dependent DNA helicase [candidate division KSB1 bacterium]MDZ7275140.1 ATP-dependent DNA helicase [candidate division KSB1 bacterium]MDZ7287310.1 ATP-dependent DNA helicase [candidate division KSB1 bacterium]MDZ7299424.1 ATP-dependent DNA helicase [candidate division KSB1 bacterium]MDZ7308063.1 ATP-dependent DNA helicase [candidate division KSB1 bacterium]